MTDSQEGPENVNLDFQAYNSEHGVMLPMLTFGGPSDAASILIQLRPEGDDLKIAVRTDVAEDRAQAVTETIVVLGYLIESLKENGVADVWQAQFQGGEDE